MNLSRDMLFNAYRPAGWLRVTGADAATFLQGQFTNELRALPPRQSAYGLWLDQKGKVLADSFVVRGEVENEFWLASYFSATDAIRARLDAYVIADDVVIEDFTAGWEAIAVTGDGAHAWLEKNRARGVVFPGRRTRSENLEWVFPGEYAAEARERLLRTGVREISALEMERLRIEAGIPAVPKDIGPGELPQEGGLEGDAVSFTKGCYLGQEVMARLKSMGRVRRRLLRVAGGSENPAALPAPLFLGSRKVGELRSALPGTDGGVTGLALLSLVHVTAESRLAFAPDGEPVMRLLDRP